MDFFCAVFLIFKYVFCLLQIYALHTLNVIGHCIVWFLFDMQISLILKIQSLSLL